MLTLVDLLETKGHTLKKDGTKRSTTWCPFCNAGDDRFIVYLESQRFWCRQCRKTGDAIAFLMELEGYSYKDAKWVIEKGTQPLDHADQKIESPIAKPKTSKIPFNHPEHGKPDHKWIYTDTDNNALFIVCRWDKETGKIMSQCKPDGLSWTTTGIKQVLYNLSEVIKSEVVFMAEGEKCADMLMNLNFSPATTSPGGAGKWPKLDEKHDISKTLYDKTVYIFPDNDDVGRAHANDIAKSLYEKANVFFLELPDLPHKGDICDYLAKHGEEKTIKDIISLIGKAKPWKPPSYFISVEELLEKKFDEQTPIIDSGIMPYGGHILIAGETGLGKSLLRMELSLHLIMGWDWLGFKIPTARRVCVLQYENSEKMESERIKKMCIGLGIEKIPKNTLRYIDRKYRMDLSTKKDRGLLFEIIEKTNSHVMVYDCLSNFHCANENDNSSMRAVLDTFTEANAKYDRSCILIHHFNKPIEGQKNQYRTRGASSILDWACTSIGFIEKPHETKELRQLEFYKVRDGKRPKTMLLERDENYLLHIIEEDTLCPPIKVREILESIGGEVDKQSILVDAIVTEIKCSPRSAVSFIHRAVETKYIIEKTIGSGYAKQYKSAF